MPQTERVDRLIQQGLMTPASMANVEAAEADGSWNAVEAIQSLEISSVLEQAFTAYKLRKRTSLPSQNR